MLRRLALLGLVALGLIVIACSGDDEGDPAPDATAEAPALGSALVAASPADLRSYRYALTVTLVPSVLDVSEAPTGLPLDQPIRITIDGDRVNPDRERSISAADLGFLSVQTETIAVGDRMWLREGNGSWTEGASPALESFAGVDFRPSVLFNDDAGQYDEVARQLEDYEWVEEDVSGIPTRHFTLDETAFFELFQGEGNTMLPAEVDATLTAEIWLARDLGVPVRLLVVGTNDADEEVMRLELNLRDLNAEDISVEPPA